MSNFDLIASLTQLLELSYPVFVPKNIIQFSAAWPTRLGSPEVGFAVLYLYVNVCFVNFDEAEPIMVRFRIGIGDF